MICNDYPHKQNFKELKEIFSNLIQYTQNQKLKKSLEIILILISHKNEDIRAYALGKLFFLMNDELIQKLIIKELKNMLYNREDISEIADHSLDSISAEIYKIETIEIFLNIYYLKWEVQLSFMLSDLNLFFLFSQGINKFL